jgi:hypothetical protein
VSHPQFPPLGLREGQSQAAELLRCVPAPLGESFPLEFDLNAATEAEWQAAGVGSAVAGRLLAERDRAPFVSVAEFEKRSGTTLHALGLKGAL